MTIYETIKAAISVKQAAEHYGLKAGRNGMACCPFHNDRHPSLKLNEDYFFCFGCRLAQAEASLYPSVPGGRNAVLPGIDRLSASS